MSATSAQALVTPVAKSVAAAGTREQLTSTPTLADQVLIQAKPGNSGNVFVGDSNVSSTRGWTLIPGQFVSFEGPRRPGGTDSMDLSTIWLDVATNGDGVQWGYFKRV